MNIQKSKLILIAAITVLSSFASAYSSDYKIVWSTIDGGGGRSSGGQYVLTGTTGQPDAAYSNSGNYQVLGGFWPGGPLCFVEFDDYARFAQYWMESGIGLPADLFEDGVVNSDDLIEFVNLWLCICPYNWPLR